MRAAALLAALVLAGCGRISEQTIAHGRFDQVVVVRQSGEVDSVAVLFTDEHGWSDRAKALARTLARNRTLVIGVPLPSFYAALEKESGGCEYTVGDVENLSHFVQAYLKVPGYFPPVLIGDGEGSAFAYANFAQAPPGPFAGVITMGFKPQLHLKRELCAGDQLETRASANGGFDIVMPKAALVDAVQFADAADTPALAQTIAQLSTKHRPAAPAPPQELADLPLVPYSNEVRAGQAVAIFWSGDGGWAGLDEEVASELDERGIVVVGVDSLRYFWSERTPDKLAADIARIVRYYAAKSKGGKVLLIGFSQGADVLPFALTRLSADVRDKIGDVIAMSLGRHAAFEFHLSNWVSSVKSDYDTAAELQKIHGLRITCIFGAEDDESVCPDLRGKGVDVIELPGSHHFNGDYAKVAEEILKAAQLKVSATGS